MRSCDQNSISIPVLLNVVSFHNAKLWISLVAIEKEGREEHVLLDSCQLLSAEA